MFYSMCMCMCSEFWRNFQTRKSSYYDFQLDNDTFVAHSGCKSVNQLIWCIKYNNECSLLTENDLISHYMRLMTIPIQFISSNQTIVIDLNSNNAFQRQIPICSTQFRSFFTSQSNSVHSMACVSASFVNWTESITN